MGNIACIEGRRRRHEQRKGREHETKRTPRRTSDGSVLTKAYDVVITSIPGDGEMCRFIKTELERFSIPCYQNSSESEGATKRVNKVLVDAKLLIIVVSDETTRSQVCQDHVSRACLSNIPVVVASIKSKDELIEEFHYGMKVTLKDLSWTIFANREDWEGVACGFVRLVQEKLSKPAPEFESPQVLPKRQVSGQSTSSTGTVRVVLGASDGVDGTYPASKSGKNSAEYQKLLKSSNNLVRQLAAAKCAGQLASKLQAEELISETVYYAATSYGPGITPLSQIQNMIDAMLLKVEGNRGHFSTFVNILQDIGSDYAQLVEEADLSG